jgi:outer membrane receptor for ferric coprogen and ferric-rhodotorulic acid
MIRLLPFVALAALGLVPAFAVAQVVAAPADAASAPTSSDATLPAVRARATTGAEGSTEQSGAYTARRTRSATGLSQTLRETPQSVSVLTRSLMDDFKLNSVNDVLNTATGVVVEKVETDRSYYTARGFDIVNFQVDGIGLPFVYGLVDGDLDTAIYDRVDVIRGANGLVAGTGNPSATINFVRKRPTRELQASAGLTLGSWNDKRVDADLSGPLAADGSVRGRLVVAAQDKDSYLDRYRLKKGVLYGIVEADLGRDTTLAFGHTQQNNRPRGGMWGALPLHYTDGTPTDYDRSTNTSPAWTYWSGDLGVSFAELQHQFGNGWQARAVATHKEVVSHGKLFYVYGTPDHATGEGLAVWPSLYDLSNRQDLLDVRVDGPFRLGGREHELLLGASHSRSKLHDRSIYGRGVGDPLPDLASWDGVFPEPIFDVAAGGRDYVDKQRSVYATARLSITDPLKLVLGAAVTQIDSTGESYGASRVKRERKTTPYAGLVYDLTPELSLYASQTAIYYPQSEVGADLNRLASADGRNSELGLKAELLERRLNASFAVFKARQDNLAEYVSFDAEHNVSIYRGVDTRSRGFEIDLAGAITPRIKLNAGYTQLQIKDEAGNDARTFSPRRVLRASTTWQALDALKLGATLSWRSATHIDQGAGIATRQPSHALLGLMARWDVNDKVHATLNVDNVTDEKYLTSLYWTQAYYGSPRSASVSLNWSY